MRFRPDSRPVDCLELRDCRLVAACASTRTVGEDFPDALRVSLFAEHAPQRCDTAGAKKQLCCWSVTLACKPILHQIAKFANVQ
jgi:hypothetical protein